METAQPSVIMAKDPDNSGSILLRRMTHKDIPLGMRLKSYAGWNQLEADWEMLLDAGSEGSFVAVHSGIEVGTVTTVTYDRRFSWIGMMLVDPAYRRRGIGTSLLKAAIKSAIEHGAVRLDATSLGKRLYDTLGFRDEYRLVRMQRMAAPLMAPPADDCDHVTQDRLWDIARYDAPIFGAARQMVLGPLFQNAPQYACYVTRDDKLSGYCLGRSGSSFEQIGPIVAADAEMAKTLLLTALRRCAHKDVIVDVPSGQEGWIRYLKALEFAEQRSFIRMCLGELRYPGQPERQYAIAGPEVG
jgi:GNAT superfamily N-acetyltransferase